MAVRTEEFFDALSKALAKLEVQIKEVNRTAEELKDVVHSAQEVTDTQDARSGRAERAAGGTQGES